MTKTAEAVLGNLVDLLWGNWMLFVLPGLGVFYTIAAGGIQSRPIPWTMKELYPKGEKVEGTRDHKGTVSSTQVFCMTVANCVGNGSTVGAATASVGGEPSASSWTWTVIFLGMTMKYAKVVLGLVSRQKGADGSYCGGPMYHVEKGLYTRLLDVTVAVFLPFQNAGGTLIQPNIISDATFRVFEVPKAVAGTLTAVAMVFIIGGGLKYLVDMAQRVVPIMASLYTAGGIVVVFISLDFILPVFRSTLQGARPMKAGMGAAAELAMKKAMCFGMARGLYSSEAGEGSAAVTHSAAWMDYSVRQGFYGVVEAFVDTMVICSTTGPSILTSGAPLEGVSAVSLAAEVLGIIAPPFRCVIPVSLTLFASTSIMSQWYLGHVSLMYIKNLKRDRFYRILFPVLVLLGSLNMVGTVWSVQDCMLGLLIIPSVLVPLKLLPVVMRMTREFSRENQQGAEKL